MESRDHQAFWRALGIAVLVHGLLLLIPSARQAFQHIGPPQLLRLSLIRQSPETPAKRETSVVPAVPAPVSSRPEFPNTIEPPITRQPAPAQESGVVSEPAPEAVATLLSRQFDYELPPDPFEGFHPEKTEHGDFRYPERPTLEAVLQAPSVQLPFEDTRVYLVDSYDPGPVGSIDRFFDKVTVPFGFTTKHGTRVQCAWIMIVAGCAWGPEEFYKRARQARRRILD